MRLTFDEYRDRLLSLTELTNDERVVRLCVAGHAGELLKRSHHEASPAQQGDPSAEVSRLTRELDVAMHGEENAAKQASLCDLIALARPLRADVARYHYLLDFPDAARHMLALLSQEKGDKHAFSRLVDRCIASLDKIRSRDATRTKNPALNPAAAWPFPPEKKR